MKKNFLIGLFLLLCNFAFSEGNLITIDNTRHIYEDNFKVINNTSEIISLDIFVKRKVNSEENKVGSGVVAPKKTDFQIKNKSGR
ncbi:hypothetical protein MSI_20720 [Treponema sp. JC4]|uniref:hypothetical protein n=1 Tax=Treponema sp. JC4 TaxID=1124982 RepID=UPI00025B0788|nr:hypothetical protein [Treponema sp. JC4]EID84426.1 hypothetical protein MSI_20720 [Treponema sp. JC4]